MLYSYPFIRHEANKLHTYICLFIRTLRTLNHTALYDANTMLHPELLKRAQQPNSYLNGHLKNFYNAYQALPTDAHKARVYEIFVNVNAVQAQLANKRPSDFIKYSDLIDTHLPETIKLIEATQILFVYLYESTLKGELAKHYKEIYEKICKISRSRKCPFCGLEQLESPPHFRQDYDHTLVKIYYAMAAVNMRNLVPMGVACNRIYKKTQDVLFDENGNRRHYFDPFEKDLPRVSVNLTSSQLPTRTNRKGIWEIEFLPNDERVQVWAIVFKLEDRYREGVLETDFHTWLKEFIQNVRKLRISNLDRNLVKAEVLDHYETLDSIGNSPEYFLKAAVFKLIHDSADDAYFDDLVQQISL